MVSVGIVLGGRKPEDDKDPTSLPASFGFSNSGSRIAHSQRTWMDDHGSQYPRETLQVLIPDPWTAGRS